MDSSHSSNHPLENQCHGQIVIGNAYTQLMGLKPGDEFEIKLGYKHIHLIQLDDNKNGVAEENEK